MAVGEAAEIVRTYFGNVVSALEQCREEGLQAGAYDEKGRGAKIPDGDAELFARPVRDLELSIRSENCLLRGGIQTIGDLLQKSREDLLKIRNLGKISLNEIWEKLESAGLKLREKKDIKATKED